MKVCNIKPVWIDEQGRVHRFRSRLVWTVACALASMQRHDGAILPCHVEALRRLRGPRARAFADAFDRLAALQRERAPNSERAGVRTADPSQPRTPNREIRDNEA